MCGIFCSITRQPNGIPPSAEHQELLQSRGPDSYRERCFRNEETGICVTLCSTVLSLRGETTTTQPYACAQESGALCWNGEAWSIAGKPTNGNDTAAVFDLLDRAQSNPPNDNTSSEGLRQRVTSLATAMSQIAGPYAFVYYDVANHIVCFGRDFLGRRSLLYRFTADGDMLIASVADGMSKGSWTEVEADGVYCVDLNGSASTAFTGPMVARKTEFSLVKTPYCYHEQSALANGTSSHSVIPRLSLNHDVPAASPPLCAGHPAVVHLENLLRRSLEPRVLGIPDQPLATPPIEHQLRPARLAILFSGGLDCTVLACLAHRIHPMNYPIDLLNVAFENPRIHKTEGNDGTVFYETCPDRITGRASWKELTHVCGEREWRFITINVPYRETLEHRQNVIKLMHPHNTEMDLSISYALYFATRGQGQAYTSSSHTTEPVIPYTTSARVLLSGLGADELFGGYQRHATAFARNGFPGLLDELDLDIGRLGKRNLGRDDRIISNWGREARFPYLDEQLLAWALSAPVTDKCGFGEQGVDLMEGADGSELLEPGKKVLRCLAWRLGMKEVAKEKKRAIQFGARTAKMETGKTKGTQLLS